MQNSKWTIKDGSEVLISEMETSHIENCLKMLKRVHLSTVLNQGRFLDTLNGEQAIVTMENEIDDIIEGGELGQFEGVWFNLKAELEYRNSTLSAFESM